MHKRMSPHGDYDHMGEAINLVNKDEVDVIRRREEFSDLFNGQKIPTRLLK